MLRQDWTAKVDRNLLKNRQKPIMFNSRSIHDFLIILALFCGVTPASTWGFQANAKPIESITALIPVEFPLTAVKEMRLIEILERQASRAVGVDRPTIVLEFVEKQKTEVDQVETVVGRGTDFVPALGLARWLSGPKGSRIRSIAFLQRSICGHAVS